MTLQSLIDFVNLFPKKQWNKIISFTKFNVPIYDKPKFLPEIINNTNIQQFILSLKIFDDFPSFRYYYELFNNTTNKFSKEELALLDAEYKIIIVDNSTSILWNEDEDED